MAHDKMTLKSNRQKFKKLVLERLKDHEKIHIENFGFYEFAIETKAGLLAIAFDVEDRFPTVYGRFLNADQAVSLLGQYGSDTPNPFSGKWNFHYRNEDSYHDAAQNYIKYLEKVL